jgi:hypothetical protein
MQNERKNMSRIRKKTFYLQFCMKNPEGLQKSIFSTSKMNQKTENSYGSYPTEFVDSIKNPKRNYRKIKSSNQTKIFPKKSIFSVSRTTKKLKKLKSIMKD